MGEVFIRVNKDNSIVEYKHSFPFDPVNGLGKTRGELLKEGYIINDYSNPIMYEGKRAIPYYDKIENKVYYEYTNIPISDQERINNLEAAINDLLLGKITLNGGE